jgi:hypothetical protein
MRRAISFDDDSPSRFAASDSRAAIRRESIASASASAANSASSNVRVRVLSSPDASRPHSRAIARSFLASLSAHHHAAAPESARTPEADPDEERYHALHAAIDVAVVDADADEPTAPAGHAGIRRGEAGGLRITLREFVADEPVAFGLHRIAKDGEPVVFDDASADQVAVRMRESRVRVLVEEERIAGAVAQCPRRGFGETGFDAVEQTLKGRHRHVRDKMTDGGPVVEDRSGEADIPTRNASRFPLFDDGEGSRTRAGSAYVSPRRSVGRRVGSTSANARPTSGVASRPRSAVRAAVMRPAASITSTNAKSPTPESLRSSAAASVRSASERRASPRANTESSQKAASVAACAAHSRSIATADLSRVA